MVMRAWLMALMCWAMIASGADAAQSFPTRALRIIVPATAGGVLDVNARRIGDKLSRALGQPVVIDNRPGASGNIGADLAARAKPDGYTLFVGSTSTLCINPFVYPKLPYDAVRAFVPVALGTVGSPVLIVHPAMPARTLAEFVAHAKANPGKVLYGSIGMGSTQQVAMELLQQLTGIELVHVHYRGTPDLLTDVIAGRVHATVEYTHGIMGHLQANKVRPIVVVGPHPKPLLPGVPTAVEAGLPDFSFLAWHGYFVPTGTPPDVVTSLNRALNAALHSADYVEWAKGMGSEVAGGSIEEFAQRIDQDREKWKTVVTRAGIRVE